MREQDFTCSQKTSSTINKLNNQIDKQSFDFCRIVRHVRVVILELKLSLVVIFKRVTQEQSTTNQIMSTERITTMSSPSPNLVLQQSVPISKMGLISSSSLIIAEGPCLLIHPTNPNNSPNSPKTKYRRFQLFPNEMTITGFAFKSKSAPIDQHQHQNPPMVVFFVWAGNNAIFVDINKNSIDEAETFPSNKRKIISLNYIPICAKFLDNGRTLAVLSVFNYVVVYNLPFKEVAKWECERENLYSGLIIGDDVDNLVIFSGTTFKGILVWTLEENQKVLIRHRLTGHQGIPFSLEFYRDLNQDFNLLLSASDDRTVVVWQFFDEEEEGVDKDLEDSVQQKFPPAFEVNSIFRGHEARVWKAIWAKHEQNVYIVSVGEDSCVRVNSLIGTMEKCWKAHDSASIYDCVYDPGADVLYTSAHDGSILKWKEFYEKSDSRQILYDKISTHPWVPDLVKINEFGRSVGNKDYPRNICLWDTNFLILTMNSGRIVAYNCAQDVQSELYCDKLKFEKYAVPAPSRQRSLLAVGGMKGDFVLLRTHTETQKSTKTVGMFAQKVFSHNFRIKILKIIWLADDAFNKVLISFLNTASLFRFISSSSSKEIFAECLQTFNLTGERPGLSAAALLNDKYLFGGDEMGMLYVYSVEEGKDCKDSICEFLAHREGMTEIVEWEGRIITAGRCGGVKSFKLGDTQELIQVHEFQPPFDWAAGLKVIPGRDLIVCGFLRGSFIIYSWNDKRVLEEIEGVGGGHRRWDFKIDEDGEDASFAYIRDREVFYSNLSIQERINSVVKPGIHCKTINCGILLKREGNSLFYATGSEDGSIRILRYDLQTKDYYYVHRMDSHESSVRTIKALNLNGEEDRIILFSGGGKSQICAFEIGISTSELTNLGKITLIKQKKRDLEIDIRIMDISILPLKTNKFLILSACSDGIARVLEFSLETKRFKILSSLQGNGHSIMRISTVEVEQKLIILGITSNGFLLCWNLNLDLISSNELIPVHDSIQLGKSALMSMSIARAENKDSDLACNFNFNLAIGSDGCSVSLWKLIISFSPDFNVNMKCELMWENDQNQRGGVIDVEIKDLKDGILISTSNDQVISKWDLKTGKILGRAMAAVTDCQGSVVEEDCVLCFGDGLCWIGF